MPKEIPINPAPDTGDWINPADLIDCTEELHQFNRALMAVVEMLAGCSDSDAPPASALWRLLALLARYADDIEQNVKQLLPADG